MINGGVVDITDIKTFNEVVELTGMKENLVMHNIRVLKREKKLIPGVDYIHTKLKHEKYTPVGIEKIRSYEGEEKS